MLAELGREIREARLAVDLSQETAAHAIGKSGSAWSRLERGQAPYLPLADLVRAGSVVGLDFTARAYAGGAPLRDAAHVALLERLRSTLDPGLRWHTEVPLPGDRDRRAWDAMILVGRVRVGVEAETRARDAQALQRRVNLKRKDGGVDHVILLLADTRHDRAFLRAAGAGFAADFPVPGPLALARLTQGNDPGGSAIVLL
jgi:transcriptional regulator with XRE-family HTH domain